MRWKPDGALDLCFLQWETDTSGIGFPIGSPAHPQPLLFELFGLREFGLRKSFAI